MIGANVELILVRGWTMVLLPSDMRCVPVREALSAITRLEAREVGGLGAAGIVDALFEDDIATLLAIKSRLSIEASYLI